MTTINLSGPLNPELESLVQKIKNHAQECNQKVLCMRSSWEGNSLVKEFNLTKLTLCEQSLLWFARKDSRLNANVLSRFNW